MLQQELERKKQRGYSYMMVENICFCTWRVMLEAQERKKTTRHEKNVCEVLFGELISNASRN